MIARQILERRLCRKLPATRDLPRDLRTAMLRLALEINRNREESQ